ncbi:phosphoenolpyruvate-protein phosphotransferase [Dyadobacter beijingensis]|uniref:Phosphoenolpyruvate-protein phosphotransferase n=1 Tax=Dyadobacter beijingensis TaxID=365489 RepID=A0ABQ2II70_9BACT|nr:phosphoenolpyruvate--protein phosphotransferase [Dyadobacter beijingensis]GGN12452.1 phosphoenolpyruvate-protein phosphotransferase [Dyadobacter beijingensis]
MTTTKEPSRIAGIGVSPGIAIGPALVVRREVVAVTGITLANAAEVAAEIGRFDEAVSRSVAEVDGLIAGLTEAGNDEGLDILETQTEFLTDPQLRADVVQQIEEQFRTAHDALVGVTDALVQLFLNMDDAYMRARHADVRDAGDRILRHLGGRARQTRTYPEGCIIVADDLSPSDTIALDLTQVAGFATQMGGPTSHAAIVAKARGIPAVVGCVALLDGIKEGERLVLDGQAGELVLRPDDATTDIYREKQQHFAEQSAWLKSLRDVSAVTKDGCAVQLLANISEPADLDQVFENGGEGVGLLRTELLFLGRDSLPDEEEQFGFYQKIALKAGKRPVTIRTIDIGGDKEAPYLGLAREENPFLGYRAIRICLDRTDIFKTQLRAVLRASAFGNFNIMFPMIGSVQEVRAAKAVLQEVRKELAEEGVPFGAEMQTGIMIEIPAAAVIADLLAKEVDFFSIGTNDLIQYTLAVDRMNDQVAALYDGFHPAVLRLIARVIEEAHRAGIHVGMCGELAGDPHATRLLLGMGLRSFSMSAVSIPRIKQQVRETTLTDAQCIFEAAKGLDSADEIRAVCQSVN